MPQAPSTPFSAPGGQIASAQRSSAPEPSTSTGRVALRDPDGGRHLIEVIAHGAALPGRSEYQVKVDGWYHVAWASSADEVEAVLGRLQQAIKAGWLPGDSDLPK